jgi:hypothetical protein
LGADAERERPPVSLAGSNGALAARTPQPLLDARPARTAKPRGHGTRSWGGESTADDGGGPYTHAQLVRFDNRYRARLLRAFQKGLESRDSAAGLKVAPATDNVPFHILTAHRRASQYQNLAGVTASTP